MSVSGNGSERSDHDRRLSRRDFIGLSGMSTAAILFGTGALTSNRALAEPFFRDNPWKLGVASGDPLPDGVVLWTRLAPEPLAEDGSGGMKNETYGVRYEVAEDENFKRIVKRGAAEATPELGHSVHPEISGLRPGREYYYRFKAGPEVSPVGRTKTAPAPNAKVDRLAFAVASCQAGAGRRYAAYRNMTGEDLDFVMHVGDYIYEGGGTRTLADFRNLHALYKTSPDLQAAHAAFPFILTFDDHEIDNNWAGDIPQDDTPNFLELRANAFQAYYENLPLRSSAIPEGPDMRLYRRFNFGDLAEFNVLDTRQYRTDQPVGAFIAPRDPDSLDPSQTMTGDEQQKWLFEGLERSEARWNVLAQQTIMAYYDYDPGDGVSINHDQWDGYVAARNRLLGFIDRRSPSNPVVVSGDWHSSWVNDLKPDYSDPDSNTVATEFVGTSISSGCPWAGDVEAALEENPHVKFFNGDYRGYIVCELTPEAWRTDLKIVTDSDSPEGPAFTLAAFAVADGMPGARRIDGVGDAISGQVTDSETGEAAPNVAVEARNQKGEVADRGTTGQEGRYQIFLPPGTYTLAASGVGYQAATETIVVRKSSPTKQDFSLEHIGVAAGKGKVIPGSRSQGSEGDIVIENGMLAMAVAVVTEDGQLPGATKGKPIDMAMRGGLDQIDWINLPYASSSQPSGTESWQQLTVRHDDVRVVEVTSGRAVVRATGSSTGFPEVSVDTTYTVEPGQEWITAETTYANDGASARTLWIGDALDHDGSGQRSGVPGHGVITAPYGSPREYPPDEPWIGMTGNDGQTYGLIYDQESGSGLTAYGTGNYMITRLRVELPAGERRTLQRRIVVADNGGGEDPFAVLARLYRHRR